jgi:asparagine synthase (glutamine-hydrolysing)
VFHRALWQRLQKIPQPLRRLIAGMLRTLPPHRWDVLLRQLAWALPRRLPRDQLGDKVHKAADVLPMRSADQLYRSLVSHWQDPASVVIGGTEPLTMMTAHGSVPTGLDATHGMMFLDGITYLPDDILVKLDRAAMAVSLETRVPLLDHEVVEFAWQLPGDLKIRDGQSKWLLRQVLDRYVPQALTDRPKMGFGVPIGEWLRGPLRPWAEDLLDARMLADQGYLAVREVRRRWDEHLTGARDWKYHLWDVLMFQAWLAAQAH